MHPLHYSIQYFQNTKVPGHKSNIFREMRYGGLSCAISRSLIYGKCEVEQPTCGGGGGVRSSGGGGRSMSAAAYFKGEHRSCVARAWEESEEEEEEEEEKAEEKEEEETWCSRSIPSSPTQTPSCYSTFRLFN